MNTNITAINFPVKGKPGSTTAYLIDFDKEIKAEQILALFNKANLRPVTMDELIDFDGQYPEEQRTHWITELGSNWRGADGDRRVGVLFESLDGTRGLGLSWVDFGWNANSRFLAFSK